MGKFLSLSLTLVAATLLAATATAQVKKIPGTGCPNARYPATVGAPAIGKAFGVIAAPCRTAGGSPFIVIGTAMRPAALPAPPACARRCMLGCKPIVVLMKTKALRVLIPNNRALIGARVCIQTGCIEAARPRCINLHGALAVQITK